MQLRPRLLLKQYMAMETKKRNKIPRHEALQGFRLALPEGTAQPGSLADLDLEITDNTEPIAPATILTDYPRLRIALRDRGLRFQATYNEKTAAPIIGRSDRTVRDWAHKDKIPCCHWPSGYPYFTAQNLEDYLVACELPRKAAR
jgi:hypothetical protein